MDSQMNGHALLGARFGMAQAGVALAKAHRQVAGATAGRGAKEMFAAIHNDLKASGWNVSDVIEKQFVKSGMSPEDAKALIAEANHYGLIDYSNVREILRMSRPGAFDFASTKLGGAANLPANMMNMMGVAEHYTDALSRGAILKAGYDLGMKQHGDSARAIREAVDLAGDAMPNNNLWNKPRIATSRGFLGHLGSIPLQFRGYGLHMYGLMGSLVKQAVTRPAERAEAIKALGGLFVNHSVHAGAVATMFALPLTAALGAYDFFSGEDKPRDYPLLLRKAIADVAGPDIATFLSGGTLASLGIDARASLKLSNLINLPEVRSFDRHGWQDAAFQLLTGPAGELTGATWPTALENIVQGNYGKGLMALAPRAIRGPIQALYSYPTEGLTDARGRTILRPEGISTESRVLTGLGFNPQEVSDFRQHRDAINSFQTRMSAGVHQALDAYVRSNGRDASAIRAWNADPDHRGYTIRYDQMRGALDRAKQLTANAQTYGLSIPAKQRPYALPEASF